ncbi:nicotinate-nucleotide adenylyltransferase [Paenibacillus sp. CAU 1782]
MGGTFDPIHMGHLIAAETAKDCGGLDEVWFIPTSGPPLKDNGPAVPAEWRLEMVRAATVDNPAFSSSDIELKRGGVSYSIDTVRELITLYPEHSFFYIIGSDRINDLPQWHAVEELSSLISFIGLERPSDKADVAALPHFLRERLRLAEMPAIGISSTALRKHLREGRSVRYLLPEAVHQLIRRHGWYGTRRDD